MIRGPMQPAVVRVLENCRETHDTFTLVLEPPAPGWRHLPGQFNMLYAFGVGEAAISLSGDLDDPAKVVHTIRSVGSVTRALETLQPGESVGVRGPFGRPWPVEVMEGRDVVVVAGGIGLAPLRPVVHHVLRHRHRYGRLVVLFGARTPEDLLYTQELERWAGAGAQVLSTVGNAPESHRGRIGMVTSLFPEAQFDGQRAVGVICGPEVMMRFMQRELQAAGVGEERTWVTLERNMQCAIGFCGHCQLGPEFVCMDGPVFRYDRIKKFFNLREA